MFQVPGGCTALIPGGLSAFEILFLEDDFTRLNAAAQRIMPVNCGVLSRFMWIKQAVRPWPRPAPNRRSAVVAAAALARQNSLKQKRPSCDGRFFVLSAF